MRTHRILQHVVGVLALAAGWIGAPAWGRGLTPQTLIWQGTTNTILSLFKVYSLGAMASSGLPVTLRVETGPAVIANGTITVNDVGTVGVTAEQAGDGTYAAVREYRNFNVRQVALTSYGVNGTGGSAHEVQVMNIYAFVANGAAGLKVVEIFGSGNPPRAVAVDTGGSANSVHVVQQMVGQIGGLYAYVAAGTSGLEVFEVTDPFRRVQLVGGLGTAGNAQEVRVVGTRAYVAEAAAGLEVFDVADPANPVRLGGYDTIGHAVGVQVLGNFAYVADLEGGLQIIDVSNPGNPIRVGGYDTGGTALGIQVVGERAYVADGAAGLVVLDVGDPTNPVRLGGYGTKGPAQSVRLEGNYAFVCEGTAGLEVIDVGNPNQPLRVGGYATAGSAQRLQVAGSVLYVATSDSGFQSVGYRLGYPQTITWGGTDNGLLTRDVAYPLSARASGGGPVTLQVKTGPAIIAAGKITVTGAGAVVVTAEQAGDGTYLPASLTRTFNVRQVMLTRVGALDTSGHAYGLTLRGVLVYKNNLPPVVEGNYAWVADGDAGLQVIDVGNPANPVRVGGYDTPGQAHGVVLGGDNYAFVADGTGGLLLIDVSNPAAPFLRSSAAAGGNVWGTPVPEGYYPNGQPAELMYAVSESAGLLQFQYGSQFGAIIGSHVVYDTIGSAHAVATYGNMAYIADGEAGLQIVRMYVFNSPIQPPPVRVGGYDTSGTAWDVQVKGNYAYVADGDAGLQVLSVGDPANPSAPVRVGGFDTGGTAYGVRLAGHLAFVAAGEAGLKAIDLTDPANPMLVGHYDTGGTARGMRVEGNLIYVAAGEAGLQIFEYKEGFPQTIQLQLPAEVPFQSNPLMVATTTSGLPLTLSVLSGPGSVVNNQLLLNGLGPVTVRVDQAGNDDFLPATAEWTVTVTDSPPRLGARLAAAQVEVFWPAGVTGLILQGRESLSLGNPWKNVTTPPVQSGGEARVQLDETVPYRYFRLIK